MEIYPYCYNIGKGMKFYVGYFDADKKQNTLLKCVVVGEYNHIRFGDYGYGYGAYTEVKVDTPLGIRYIRLVYDMQHNRRLSRNIIFSEMYDEIATESEKTFTAKEQRNIREYIPQVLDYWTHQKFIKGYEAVKGGNKIRGYAIKI